MNLQTIRTVIFDCDGVVLNSNGLKTAAFRAVTLPFGNLASLALVDFHKRNGGAPRLEKFEYFFDTVLPAFAKKEKTFGDKAGVVGRLLQHFSKEIKEGLLRCEVAPGLRELRDAMPDAKWAIVSAADQGELREIFDQRGLAHYFNAGIYGGPKDKRSIICGLLEAEKIDLPALSLGDSLLDHEVAKACGLDFIFVHEWTELPEWLQHCQQRNIPVIPSISNLLRIGDMKLSMLD